MPRSSLIQSRVQICNDLKQRKLGDEALKGQEEIRTVRVPRHVGRISVNLQLYLKKGWGEI